MKIAYLDCFAGFSGDRMLGALVHAGVDAGLFRETIAALGVDGHLKTEHVNLSGMSATKVHVLLSGDRIDHTHLQGNHHSHEHTNTLTHGHSPVHSHDSHNAIHTHERSLREIEDLISRAAIDADARALALHAFHILGEAEAKILNIPVDEIHFHEVGAISALVEIVCSAVGCISLRVDRWVCSALNVGGGTVPCAHGIFPVPIPVTAELLKNCPVYSSGAQGELVTPAGAAILRALRVEFGAMPPMVPENLGYGAGIRDLPGFADVVRITLGTAVEAEQLNTRDVVTVIETALDDLPPQVVGYVMDQLLANGALDVMVTPVQMKKSRPGHLLTVLCMPDKANALCDLLLRETTTLGVRMREEKRKCLQRTFAKVITPWGEVRIKLGYLCGEVANCSPEFEDCRRIAELHKVPLKTVMQEAMRLYSEKCLSVAD